MLSAINLVFGVINVVQGEFGSIVGAAISGLIVWYYYTPEVRAFFGQSHRAAPWDRKAAA